MVAVAEPAPAPLGAPWSAASPTLGCYGLTSPPADPADLGSYMAIQADGIPVSVAACAAQCQAGDSSAGIVLIGQLLNRQVCACAADLALFTYEDPYSCENACVNDNEPCGTIDYSNRFSVYNLSNSYYPTLSGSVAVGTSTATATGASSNTGLSSPSTGATTTGSGTSATSGGTSATGGSSASTTGGSASFTSGAASTSSATSPTDSGSPASSSFFSQGYAVPLVVVLGIVFVAAVVATAFFVTQYRRQGSGGTAAAGTAAATAGAGEAGLGGGGAVAAKSIAAPATAAVAGAGAAGAAASTSRGAPDDSGMPLLQRDVEVGGGAAELGSVSPPLTSIVTVGGAPEAAGAVAAAAVAATAAGAAVAAKSGTPDAPPATAAATAAGSRGISLPVSESSTGGFLIASVLGRTPNMRYDVVRGYDPTAAESARPATRPPGDEKEVVLRRGDQVKVVSVADDGWGLGTNETTGETGYFPIAALIGDVSHATRL
ncbi:hypothetical protein HK405_004050 [Cladochytrium tenue]|nr:hypothetical protein HK405_004050 [Cladochytrium tenue]